MSEWGFRHFWLRGILTGAKGSTGTALNIQLTCIPRDLTLTTTGQSRYQFHLFHSSFCFTEALCPKATWSAFFFLLLRCGDEIQGDAGATNANSFQQSDSIKKILHWPTTHTIKPPWSHLMIQISYSRADTAGHGDSTQSTYSILPPWPCLNRQCNGDRKSVV